MFSNVIISYVISLRLRDSDTDSEIISLIRYGVLYQVARKSVPYFFGYKTELFSVQNNPKDLDPSCKTDQDLWGCLGRAKLVL